MIVSLLLFVWLPPEARRGWTRWRVAGFHLLWQAFTPLRAWHIDLPLFALACGLMELAWYAYHRTVVRKAAN